MPCRQSNLVGGWLQPVCLSISQFFWWMVDAVVAVDEVELKKGQSPPIAGQTEYSYHRQTSFLDQDGAIRNCIYSRQRDRTRVERASPSILDG